MSTPATKKLGQALLQVTDTQLIIPRLTLGYNGFVRVSCVIVCNTAPAPHKVTLRANVLNPALSTKLNSWLDGCDIAANTTYILNEANGFEGILMVGEDFIGLADVADVIAVSTYGAVESGI